jgi:hypothetical protein
VKRKDAAPARRQRDDAVAGPFEARGFVIVTGSGAQNASALALVATRASGTSRLVSTRDLKLGAFSKKT